ncbi:fungal-specific transcription factor domain-containing protein [Ilyonectria robusta]|uniref:fungal-specific transcription factor domain-containing protein n=1 Tax=Ilyonectria robusta TaxID=1079257 RepID=UPI001E8DA9ED|nr:fungal-specific transcription factor domain-containing protein [Ilyonectria robusta]KAH8694585.1 fungal-specific transcription factor domain-containing protein [Ilyonectria robusta]
MPGKRSRQGCEECRKRRRKCDESKPTCGQCFAFKRSCHYTLKLVWGGRKFKKSCFGVCLNSSGDSAERIDGDNGGFVYGTKVPDGLALIPQSLPNGMHMPQRYRRLLDYFTKDILPSLSCHPSINEDLCKGLLPAMLQSPLLLSAGLALSAAGFSSRGLTEVDGVDIFRVIEHLQSSGLSLLRTALANGQMDEIVLVTCLVWCLADVFAGRQEISSWRIHLQGVKAILGGDHAYQQFVTNPGPVQSAMKHLYLLYLSLQTLPHLPSLQISDHSTVSVATSESLGQIDGFLGYSEEVLEILQQINQLPSSGETTHFEADVLLGKVKGMISRDAKAPPNVSISSVLTPESGRDFALCHKTFQQATLIHLYRRLYNMPSGSQAIQSAVEAMNEMISNMTQGQPCNTWVAMAMPVFTIGCEAFTADQKTFVLDKVDKLEVCLGSLHVRILRQALEDIWKLRTEWQDFEGKLCASELLKELQYNIILF